ncbi:hypothetical protein SK128_022112, partial [Halocaridina rubra]
GRAQRPQHAHPAYRPPWQDDPLCRCQSAQCGMESIQTTQQEKHPERPRGDIKYI